ncbi:MAG: right-handed parallel beta-helix repeat-containing protein [Anaerolineales bacterium]|nr:right-handed parallel beta-helix repeat-containing protein [Anaerolineales bacterium]
MIWTTLTLFVLIVSAACPQVVLADGETPPPQATETVVLDETETATPAPTEVISETETATPAPTEVISETETATPAPTEVIGETETATPAPTEIVEPEETPIVASLPEETTLIVLDESGAPIPLATQQAADAILLNDPIWCPEGAQPIAGSGGCTASYTNLADLVTYLSGAQPASNGTIWITSGTDTSAAPITIDGSVLSAWANYELTIQGGWDGSATGTISGQTNFDVGLAILDWNNNIVVNNLTFGDTNSTESLLVAINTGDITLDSVNANGNTGGAGAILTNDIGDVTVNNGSFSNNDDTGLFIGASDSSISLANVTADNNNSYGALITTGTGNVNVTNSSFSDNSDTGVIIGVFDGTISLANITANLNGGDGAGLYADSQITITDSSFSENDYGGLSAASDSGSISLTDVFANYNGSGVGSCTEMCPPNFGAELAAGDDITITGGAFQNNFGSGLIGFADDSISLSTVTISDNGNSPAGGDGAYLDALGDITVENTWFERNLGYGLSAASDESIVLEQVTARNNGNDGVNLFADTDITVTYGTFSDNGWSGIYAEANGDVTVNCITAEDNSDYGVETDAPALTLNDVIFSGNGLGDYINTGTVTLGTCTTDGGGDPGDEPGSEPSSEPSSEPNSGSGSSLTWQIVSVNGNGNEKANLNCAAYLGTILILPNEDRIILPCPIGEQATLARTAQDQLPKPIDSSLTFVSALEAQVLQELDGTMLVNFFVPADQQNLTYTILRWDETQWVDMGGAFNDAGFFETASAFDGIFVLVRK